MTQVFVTTYEIVGEGLKLAEAHFAEVDRVEGEHWKVVKQFSAKGYRPGPTGGIRSLFFKEMPTGFRKVGFGKNKAIEAVPHKGSKAGKAAHAAIDAVPRTPRGERLAVQFGYGDAGHITDGYSIYFATAMRIHLPRERYFLRLPRQEGDGYVAPDTLKAMPESEFMAAIEAHNEIAQRSA